MWVALQSEDWLSQGEYLATPTCEPLEAVRPGEGVRARGSHVLKVGRVIMPIPEMGRWGFAARKHSRDMDPSAPTHCSISAFAMIHCRSPAWQ